VSDPKQIPETPRDAHLRITVHRVHAQRYVNACLGPPASIEVPGIGGEWRVISVGMEDAPAPEFVVVELAGFIRPKIPDPTTPYDKKET
jgi:hypothetical protein